MFHGRKQRKKYGWKVGPISKTLAPLKKSYEKSRYYIQKQRHHFANKGLSSQSYGFSSSHVWMWEPDHKEGWALKNWSFQTVVLEKTLESPLFSKEIKPVILKEINPEYSLEGQMLKLKLQYFGHLMQRADNGKDLDARKYCGQEKGMTEDEKVGWHHQLSGHEFEQALGDGEGQGSLACLQSMGLQRAGHNWVTKQQQQTSWSLWAGGASGRETSGKCFLIPKRES